MADLYRWGGVTPPSVVLLKRRRVHRDSRKRNQAASLGSTQAVLQSPGMGCAQVVAKAVCAELARQERNRRALSALLDGA
jgi:hypothetical protein